MATIYNTEHIKGMINKLKLAPAREKIPTELADKILPVYSINYPYNIQNKRATMSNNTSTTIFTTSNVADTYLVGCSLSFIKDATATTTAIGLKGYTFDTNGLVSFIEFPSITLTAHTDSLSITFPFPIKLARNTIVQITSATANANVLVTGIVQYFEIPD